MKRVELHIRGKDDRGGLVRADHPITSAAFFHSAQEFSGRLRVLLHSAEHEVLSLCIVLFCNLCIVMCVVIIELCKGNQIMSSYVVIVIINSIINSCNTN